MRVLQPITDQGYLYRGFNNMVFIDIAGNGLSIAGLAALSLGTIYDQANLVSERTRWAYFA
jgi:hypothetical protein